MITEAFIYQSNTTRSYIYWSYNIQEIIEYILNPDHYISSKDLYSYDHYISSDVFSNNLFKTSKEYNLILHYISSNISDIFERYISSRPSSVDHYIRSIVSRYLNTYISSKPINSDKFESSSGPYTKLDHYVSSK